MRSCCSSTRSGPTSTRRFSPAQVRGLVSGSKSDLPVRLGAALAMISGALAAMWFGGFVFWLIVAIGALLMLSEWAGLVAAVPQRRIAQYALTVPLALLCPPPVAMGPSWLVLGLILGAAFFIAAVTR